MNGIGQIRIQQYPGIDVTLCKLSLFCVGGNFLCAAIR